MTEETKVQFNLWAVLTFIGVMGSSSFLYLHAEGRETKAKQREVIERVIVLEERTKVILDGILELKQGQKDVLNALSAHEKSTLLNGRILKWNDIKRQP